MEKELVGNFSFNLCDFFVFYVVYTKQIYVFL